MHFNCHDQNPYNAQALPLPSVVNDSVVMFYTLPQHPTLTCVDETINRNKSRRKVQLRTGGETSDLC